MPASSKNPEGGYDDSYPTCDETYVTLCMYPKEVDPREISKWLGLEPSSIQICGETKIGSRAVQINAWFLSSKGKVNSKDSRRHLDWVLDQIGGKDKVLNAILEKGTKANLCCFWRTKHGHGSPVQSPDQMRKIGKLGLELWYDFYA
jgi:Domain of unknown function (DUF4279)